MISNAFQTRQITRATLAAMREDAAQCNRRLLSVLRSVETVPGDGETQYTRVARHIAVIFEMSAGQPFTRPDVMAWTGRSEPNSDSLVRVMVARGLIVRDGKRGRAYLYRWTGTMAASLPAGAEAAE